MEDLLTYFMEIFASSNIPVKNYPIPGNLYTEFNLQSQRVQTVAEDIPVRGPQHFVTF